LLKNDFSGVSVRVDRYISEKSLTINVDTTEYTTFCREILKAEIEALKVEKERMSGNYDNNYDNYRAVAVALTPVQTAPVFPAPTAEATVLLSKVVEEHINDAMLANSWTEKTLQENISIFKVMIDIIGDQDINAIDNQIFLDFKKSLAKLPPNRDKVSRYIGKTISQILAMKNVEPMSVTTVNKYLTRIASLFKWAAKKKFIKVNYAEGLSFSKKTNAYEEREAYSKEDIQRLFTHLKFNEASPQEYWIPLIALYEGMRLEEICQMHMADIIEMDALPCININSDGDKKIKTNAGKRIIPIHPKLIELGFMDYINSLRKLKAVRVWPKLSKGRDGYSHIYGKKYQRFNREFITKNSKRVFHSFRHTVTDTLKQAGVSETVIAEIVGHSTSGSMTMGRYGKRYQPKVLLEALVKLDYGIEIPELASRSG
jgi:integrase